MIYSAYPQGFQPYVPTFTLGRGAEAGAASGMAPSSGSRVSVISPMAFSLDLGSLAGADTAIDFWLYTPQYARVERATLIADEELSTNELQIQFVQREQDGIVELSSADRVTSLSAVPLELSPPGTLRPFPLYARVYGEALSNKVARLTLHVISDEPK